MNSRRSWDPSTRSGSKNIQAGGVSSSRCSRSTPSRSAHATVCSPEYCRHAQPARLNESGSTTFATRAPLSVAWRSEASNSEPKRVILPEAARGRASTGESDTYGIHNWNDQA